MCAYWLVVNALIGDGVEVGNSRDASDSAGNQPGGRNMTWENRKKGRPRATREVRRAASGQWFRDFPCGYGGNPITDPIDESSNDEVRTAMHKTEGDLVPSR